MNVSQCNTMYVLGLALIFVGFDGGAVSKVSVFANCRGGLICSSSKVRSCWFHRKLDVFLLSKVGVCVIKETSL